MSDLALELNELDAPRSLDEFLASVEQRAYRMALMALSDHDEALDVVQDTMIRLVRKYVQRPPLEWRTLFFTILHNRITDSHRKNTLRQRLFGWWHDTVEDDEDEEHSTLNQISTHPSLQPLAQLQSQHTMTRLEQAVAALPLRQQQAFLLRMVEGLDTEATAQAMSCSTGSVKTHLSRALSALKEALQDYYEPA